jgi:YhcN/YlaJ family sporulation lipoprotein
MKRRHPLICVLVLFGMLAGLATAGCGQTVQDIGGHRGNIHPAADVQDLRTAQMLANTVRRIPGVAGAYVLRGPGTAYVAVDRTGSQTSQLTEPLRTAITDAVRNQDPSIHKVLITSDPGAYLAFQKYAANIRDGRPISGLWHQLQDVIRQTWPSFQ